MVEVRYTRPSEPVIDRLVVAACTDVPQLREWHMELDIVANEVTEAIKAAKLAELDATRASHKLTFLRVAQTWITRRLKALVDEMSPEDMTQLERQRLEIARLHRRVAELGEQNALLRDARDVRKLALVVHAAGGYVVASERHAEELADVRLEIVEDRASGDVTFTTEVQP